MSTKEKAGIGEAATLLVSPAMREAARALRKRSVDGLPWDLWSVLDTTLKRDVERVAVELLPHLAKVYKWQMIPTNQYPRAILFGTPLAHCEARFLAAPVELFAPDFTCAWGFRSAYLKRNGTEAQIRD